MIDRTGFSLGYCFGTILMRSSKEDVYYTSIDKELKKTRFYLVSLGDEEEEEPFWITGREIITLYATPMGFSIIQGSQLEKDIMSKISDSDYSTFHHVFGDGARYGGDHYRDLSSNPIYRNPKDHFVSLDDVVNTIKPLGKNITVYFIQTKTIPYYLEEVIHYVNTEKSE